MLSISVVVLELSSIAIKCMLEVNPSDWWTTCQLICFFFILQKLQTPNRKAARASASTPETARGFANLGRGSKKSPLAGSPSSRKRLSDSYGAKGKAGGHTKGHMTDRLSLKRKAMATLTSAKRMSPKNQGIGKKLKSSQSDGALMKRKVCIYMFVL